MVFFYVQLRVLSNIFVAKWSFQGPAAFWARESFHFWFAQSFTPTPLA
jgi:hypothetical protein